MLEHMCGLAHAKAIGARMPLTANVMGAGVATNTPVRSTSPARVDTIELLTQRASALRRDLEKIPALLSAISKQTTDLATQTTDFAAQAADLAARTATVFDQLRTASP